MNTPQQIQPLAPGEEQQLRRMARQLIDAVISVGESDGRSCTGADDQRHYSDKVEPRTPRA